MLFYFVGSLSNRERQKNPEDHGDVSLSNFESDPSSNDFKSGQWLRPPTGLISREVWSFSILCFVWRTLVRAGDPKKCFCTSQDSDEAESSLCVSLIRFFVVRRFVHVDISTAVAVHFLSSLLSIFYHVVNLHKLMLAFWEVIITAAAKFDSVF